MKGLAEKFRARPTPMNPSLLSTASDDRRDPAIALDLMSRLVSVSLATKRCDEPRRQHWPDTRERPYEFVVRVFTSKRINFVIVDSSSSDKLLQQTGPRHNSGTAGGKDRHVGSGLGLAIVKQLVGAMGGAVTVESSAAGSTFAVRLRPQPRGVDDLEVRAVQRA